MTKLLVEEKKKVYRSLESLERRRQANREYKLKNKEIIKEKNKIYYLNNPDKIRGYTLKDSYGISLDDYDNMVKVQKGCCAICGIHQSELKKRLFVDHCHTTGKVRKLLCHHCNLGLGGFRDNPSSLLKAIKYLNETK